MSSTLTTPLTTPLKRDVLGDDRQRETTQLLQKSLVNLVDLALLSKQAHWNVLGPNFRSIHLQLDEIIDTVREASDAVAERITTLGIAADGRAQTISRDSLLQDYPRDFQDVSSTVSNIADALKETVDCLRDAIAKLGELDPVSEDLCIGISAKLEKHLWMIQAQEVRGQ